MSFDIRFIKAETHTPEYLMHKYWARKPHNVISECIEKLSNEGDVVLDPFCGSGVTLREGGLLGRNCYGFDVNPIAVLISKVLVNPPNPEIFVDVFKGIYNDVIGRYGYLYKTKEGRVIKYLSHRIIVKCECGENVTQADCIKDGKKYICPHCGCQLRFNLESLVDTEIFNVMVENDKSYVPDIEELERQKNFSKFYDESIIVESYIYIFPENRRILAFDGIKTSDFFTERNFCILSCFANEIWNIQDEKVKNCALLLLTSTVAQCSRLIANRNNLSTGGPAWSVPGFWVPQEHLEGNPFIHFAARLKKYEKALKKLTESPITGKSNVILGNSLDLLQKEEYSKLKGDIIFLDPPYGDSVPYTEFSNIWNSFLKSIPSSEEDISVSDRIDKNISWENYKKNLNEYMKCFSQHLTKKGKLLITFNNNDMRAWSSLISALQSNGFVCRSVFYQIPAVISSKAQMSIKSSYISDIYSVYTYSPEEKVSRDLSPLISYLCYIANSRGGIVSKIVLDREFIINWLKNNIDYNLLEKKDDILNSLFIYDKKECQFIIKESYKQETELLKDEMKRQMDELNKSGMHSILDSYLYVSEKCQRFGTIELYEFKEFLKDYATDEKDVYGYTQMSLFDL